MKIDESIIAKYKIDALIFSKNKLSESLDFDDIPVLVVEEDLFGTLYLSYLDRFIDENLEQRILIKITNSRLQEVKNGSISVKYAFDNPESDDIYLVRFREDTDQVCSVSLIPASIFSEINPISSTYKIVHSDSTKLFSMQDIDAFIHEFIIPKKDEKNENKTDFLLKADNDFSLDSENIFASVQTKNISTGNYYEYRY